MTTTDYRLTKDVLPTAYRVTLDATPKKASFSGTVEIDVKTSAARDVLELHARDLKVDGVVALAGGKKRKAKVKARKDRETVELVFDAPLPRGKLTLKMAFKGKLNPSMHGLYLAKDGPERAIVSQCEATDARAIFPCFDEPEFKATFQWTVVTEPGLIVITNGVPLAQKKSKGRAVHTFKPTRLISSYLVAVTIGELESSKVKKIVGAPCRSWGGKGKAGLTDFAQEVTAQVLPWYERYFGQKYNYQKLDQVAVPGFDAGAMENVGAIFYRQNLLLMQPGVTSFSAQKRIAEVIAHELAHQWFGNLVTMKWWDDLWLNEAFATWIAFKAVDVWKPEWRMWDDYLESKESALAADALVNTHPVYTPVKTPAEATELFDVITYEKGCAVLRMCESFLGEAAFMKGIQRYQAAFKNKNAAGADLWNSLGEASGQPVRELMESWVTQSGFPLVTVEHVQRGGQSVLRVSQRRFFGNAREMQAPNEQLWTIPMVIRFGVGGEVRTHRHLMRGREEEIVLPAKADWVHPNAAASGFYRVRFADAALRELVSRGLAAASPAERMTLIEDQWSLVRNGLSSVDRFLDTLVAFRGESDYIVTRSMTARLAALHQSVVAETHTEKLAALTRWFFGEALSTLGYEAKPGEAPGQGVRRAAVLQALGEIGRDPAVLAEAKRRVEREMQDPASVDPNIAGTLTSLTALDGDRALLDRYVATFQARKKARSSPDLQARYVGALSSFERAEVARRVLALCLDETVPQEQLRVVLSPLLARRATQRAAWEFMKEHWAVIGPRVGSMGVARLVESTGALPYELKADLERFFTEHPVEEAKRALQKALEAMTLRHELVQRERQRLSQWLDRGWDRAARSA